MKRLTNILLFIFSALLLSAQTQQGYVKTKGRLDKDGKVITGVSLAGVAVTINDSTVLISAADGTFSFSVQDNAYVVNDVHKNGYILTDPGLLRSYRYLPNPLTLVMETSEQQNEDKLMAERKINRTLRRTLQQREDELDSLKSANRNTNEEYEKLYAQLYENEKRNRKIINEMVERYAKVDFDQMDEFNREINICILKGELLKADSLINCKGSIDTCITEYNRLHEANAHGTEELKKRSENFVSGCAIKEKILSELAEDCYNNSKIYELNQQSDSAVYFLMMRAELDTTNIQWQLEAGNFLSKYLTDYEKGWKYYSRALYYALGKSVEQNLDVALCYNNIGIFYSMQSEYSKALEYLRKSLNIYSGLYGYNTQEADSCSKTIYETYCKLLQQSDEKMKEFEDFMSEYSFTIDISEGETPSSAQGMFGQYYLLEFGDWNFLSTTDLFEKSTELQGKPKDIVVMKDGVITKLEDKVDCQISLKYVGKEEKQRIVESHNKWKKE